MSNMDIIVAAIFLLWLSWIFSLGAGLGFLVIYGLVRMFAGMLRLPTWPVREVRR